MEIKVVMEEAVFRIKRHIDSFYFLKLLFVERNAVEIFFYFSLSFCQTYCTNFDQCNVENESRKNTCILKIFNKNLFFRSPIKDTSEKSDILYLELFACRR